MLTHSFSYFFFGNELEEDATVIRKYKAINLNKAFFLLDVENVGFLEKRVVKNLLIKTNSFSQLRRLSVKAIKFFVDAMDLEGEGKIRKEAFSCLTLIFSLKIKSDHRKPKLHRLFPSIFNSKPFLSLIYFVKRGWLDRFFLFLLSLFSSFLIEFSFLLKVDGLCGAYEYGSDGSRDVFDFDKQREGSCA